MWIYVWICIDIRYLTLFCISSVFLIKMEPFWGCLWIFKKGVVFLHLKTNDAILIWNMLGKGITYSQKTKNIICCSLGHLLTIILRLKSLKSKSINESQSMLNLITTNPMICYKTKISIIASNNFAWQTTWSS